MSPVAQGFENILGIGKETAYGTEVVVTEALPFVSEDFGNEIEKIMDDVLRGKAGAGAYIKGNKSYPFTLPMGLTYQDCDRVIAMAMGTAGVPVVNGGLYDNTYSLAEEVSPSATMALWKGVTVWSFAGCKFNTLKISGQANKPLTLETSGAAKLLTRASATNTSGVLQALNTEDDAGKIMFSDLEFKMAGQATALAGTTALGIGSMTLSLDNKMKLDDFDNRALTILEPVRNGIREVKLSLTIPRYEADTYLDWRDNDTALHGSLKFTSGNYLFHIQFAKAKIDDVRAPTSGPGLINQQIEMTLFRDPGSVSADYTFTDEFRILVTNGRSTSPLA